MSALKIQWIDGGREPRNPPDPEFPNGIDLDLSLGAGRTCSVDLPYPARRCGHYYVFCPICGHRSVLSTAGRPDDPRSVKVACRLSGAVN